MSSPVLQVSGAQVPFNEPQETAVDDLLAENRKEDCMIDVIEAASYVALDEPDGAPPPIVDFAQRGMAPSTLPKPMRSITELRFLVRIQHHPHRFLQKPV